PQLSGCCCFQHCLRRFGPNSVNRSRYCRLHHRVVASDEFGLRKPHPDIVRTALAIADTAPQSAFFLGDKPENDAYAAAQCGIGHRVLVAGGSTSHTELAAAVTDGTATHLIDEPGDLLTL